mmetsp:Transcript_171/g.567  ORF Transcript_171/g.567 Transcript_171/m.567 type:complete len:240 (+) Transcript_171:407-1126(+)
MRFPELAQRKDDLILPFLLALDCILLSLGCLLCFASQLLGLFSLYPLPFLLLLLLLLTLLRRSGSCCKSSLTTLCSSCIGVLLALLRFCLELSQPFGFNLQLSPPPLICCFILLALRFSQLSLPIHLSLLLCDCFSRWLALSLLCSECRFPPSFLLRLPSSRFCKLLRVNLLLVLRPHGILVTSFASAWRHKWLGTVTIVAAKTHSLGGALGSHCRTACCGRAHLVGASVLYSCLQFHR